MIISMSNIHCQQKEYVIYANWLSYRLIMTPGVITALQTICIAFWFCVMNMHSVSDAETCFPVASGITEVQQHVMCACKECWRWSNYRPVWKTFLCLVLIGCFIDLFSSLKFKGFSMCSCHVGNKWGILICKLNTLTCKYKSAIFWLHSCIIRSSIPLLWLFYILHSFQMYSFYYTITTFSFLQLDGMVLASLY